MENKSKTLLLGALIGAFTGLLAACCSNGVVKRKNVKLPSPLGRDSNLAYWCSVY